jgi:glycosyltransferase involved in cell wall biosynthesis
MENKRLKILIVSDTIPYPLSSGGRICTFNFIDYLRTKHDFTLIAPSHSEEIQENKETLQKLWPNVTIESVDLYNSNKKSFVVRVVDFIKRKLDLLQNKIDYVADLEYKRKLNFTVPFSPINEHFILSVQKTCQQGNFDIIQVQYTHNLNLITILPNKPKKIFEQIESQFDVIKDYAKTKEINQTYADYLVKNSEKLENFYINQYDGVFTLNENDTEYFRKNLINSKVFTSPFGVLDREINKNNLSKIKIKKIVFSGNETHYPNYDALKWYLSVVHHKIYSEFGLNIHITGNWSDGSKNNLKSLSKGVYFDGIIDDYSSFLNNSIVVVPIRIGGGGLRTKILYAMANGAPVVATSIGAFGIKGNNKEHLLIANNENDFYNSIKQLILNKIELDLMIKNAHELILNEYSQSVTAELRNKYYLNLVCGKK